MPYNTKALLVDLNGNFIPQGFNPSADEYRPTTGVDLGDNRHALDMLAWGKTSGGVYVPIRVSTDGVQEVTLNGSIVDTEDNVLRVKQYGTIMELYGATIDERPPANSVPVGATYMAVNTQDVWQSNGTDWVVM